MTLTKQDDGGFWISGPLAGVILAALFGAFGAVYTFQNDRLWNDGQDIAKLTVTVTNDSAEVNKLEAAIGGINQTMANVADSLRGLKDGADNLKDQIHALQQQVSGLEDILRPPPSFPHH